MLILAELDDIFAAVGSRLVIASQYGHRLSQFTAEQPVGSQLWSKPMAADLEAFRSASTSTLVRGRHCVGAIFRAGRSLEHM